VIAISAARGIAYRYFRQYPKWRHAARKWDLHVYGEIYARNNGNGNGNGG